MPVEVALGTPLADALSLVIQPKLVENGWSTGDLDDNALAEYILLMLVNGKAQQEMASELSTDLLGLSPEDSGAKDFAQWLFEQVETLNGNGQQPNTNDQAKQEPQSAVVVPASLDTNMMDGSADGQTNIPTGPKSMLNGAQKSRDKRMFGQMTKTLEQNTGSTLHKIRGTAGTGRINSHARDPPKGPRNPTIRNQPLRQGGNPPVGPPGMGNPMTTMSPQQQMALFAMYEEQARMMAQILSPQQQQQMFPNQSALNPNANVFPQQPGKSLFDRVERKPVRNNGYQSKRQPNGQDSNAASGTGQINTNVDIDMEQEDRGTARPDPSTTMCTFNLACTRADCHFVHQSPAAPPGTSIDMTDECSFGAACLNRKCVGRHPSPAKRTAHKAEMDCKFYPNCTNPVCPFKHPDTPPCRNGADCTVPNCKFVHNTVLCKFNPCLNPACPFKHVHGQKRGAFEDKVWIGGQEKEHVSERKFVDEDTIEEELILPVKAEEAIDTIG